MKTYGEVTATRGTKRSTSLLKAEEHSPAGVREQDLSDNLLPYCA